MTGFAVVNEGALEHVSTQPGLIWLDFWQASCAPCVPTIVVLRDGREIARLDGLIRETDLEDVLRAASAGA